MSEIGVFTPEQARELWQDYQRRKQLQPHIAQNYPVRRPIDEPSPHRVFVKNASGETCPAYGCMQITGTEIVAGITCVTITKPTDTTGEFLLNSQFAISAGANGWAYRFGVVIALGDAPSAACVQYGPVVGEWILEEGSGFFTVFGEHNAETEDAYQGAVIGRFVGGSKNNHHIWFDIDDVYCADAYDDWHLIVTPTWYTGGCTATIPGVDSYTGQADIYDICNIHGYYVDEALIGTVGRATYMYPRTGDCEPKWLLDTLCLQPECA